MSIISDFRENQGKGLVTNYGEGGGVTKWEGGAR